MGLIKDIFHGQLAGHSAAHARAGGDQQRSVGAHQRPARRLDAKLLTRFDALVLAQRNMLRLMFADPGIRARQDHWQTVAKILVGALRADAPSVGTKGKVAQIVDELSRVSPAFETLRRANAFAVDRRPDLGMIRYNTVKRPDADRMRSHIASHPQ